MKQTLIVTILCAFLLTACAGTATSAAPITWIDKPLPDRQYLIEPIDLMIYANAQQGVSAVAFAVNGQLVEALPLSENTGPFVSLPHVWTPPAAGTYTLSFAAQDVNGTWGASSEVTIQVVTKYSNPLDGSNFVVDDVSEPAATTEDPTAHPPSVATITPLPTSTFISIPATPTLTHTPPPPAPTTALPPTDMERPVILELEWDPISPKEDSPVSFNVTAQDNVGVTRIEIYFVRQSNGNNNPIYVCSNTNVCSYDAINGFSWGVYSYYATAYDAAGNHVSTFTQAVKIEQVVK